MTGGVAAVIVAGGRGQRAGGDVPKQYRLVAGEAVIRPALRTFVDHPKISAVQPVIHVEDDAACEAATAGLKPFRSPVSGGSTRQASVRAAVEGRVLHVLVDEGQRVAAGQPLVTLENLDLESELARVRADLRVASARATQSQMRYGDFGTAERERLRLSQEDRSLSEKTAKLQLVSPIDGVVATPRLHDLIGSHLDEGARSRPD